MGSLGFFDLVVVDSLGFFDLVAVDSLDFAGFAVTELVGSTVEFPWLMVNLPARGKPQLAVERLLFLAAAVVAVAVTAAAVAAVAATAVAVVAVTAVVAAAVTAVVGVAAAAFAVAVVIASVVADAAAVVVGSYEHPFPASTLVDPSDPLHVARSSYLLGLDFG